MGINTVGSLTIEYCTFQLYGEPVNKKTVDF